MAGWGNTDYIAEPRPNVVVRARPKGNRVRHGSEAFLTQAAVQTVMVDESGNLLTPTANNFGRMQRSSSVSGGRPAIIINNDNGASQQYYDERPRSSHGHRRRPSSGVYNYDGELVRVRSSSRARRASPYYDDDYYYESDEYEDGRRRVVRRERYHSSREREHRESKNKRSAEDEALIKELDDMKKKEEAERQRKRLLEEEEMKRLKAEKERLEREDEDKRLKEHAIEEYKLKKAEEDEKEAKKKQEEEDRMVQMLMAGTPGMTESNARKYIRRAGRNKDRASKGDDGIEGGSYLQPTSNAVGRVRPTYIKVHSRHLSPATLEAFGYPWEWDEEDSDYIIIKRWVSEYDQELLFEHTRKIKERAAITYPRHKLKEDMEQIVLTKRKEEKRKKSPIKKTSWFLT